VKPAFALPAAAVLAALLAGCGQPGPLYMPPPLKPTPATAAPVPAPGTPSANAPASAVPTSGRNAPGNLPIPVSSSPVPTQQ
jgi:predicted small lipoprotein YifL